MMGPRTLALCVGACVALSGCGTASVQYSSAYPSPTGTDEASEVALKAILARSAHGGQTAVLPVSRLVIVETQSTGGSGPQTVDQGPADGKANPAPPPPDELQPPPEAPPAGGGKGKGAGAAAPGATPQPHQAAVGAQPSQDAASQGGNTTTKDNGPSSSTVTSTLAAADGTKYSVTVVQAESRVSFQVAGTNNFFSNNQLSITRLANTRIPTTVSNTFTDETASRVKTIASIVTTVATAAGLAAAEAPGGGGRTAAAPKATCLTSDLRVDDAAVLNGWTAPAQTPWTSSPSAAEQGCPFVQLEVQAPRPDVDLVPVAEFKRLASTGGDWSKVWPVPACMTVKVTIWPTAAKAEQGKATGLMTVIDPDYVELLPVPQKGKLAMHPVCSADLSDSAGDKYQAAFDTMSAIAAALPAKKTSN